jgi:hypothetical protein
MEVFETDELDQFSSWVIGSHISVMAGWGHRLYGTATEERRDSIG